jgi:hypothetical protein
VTRRESDPTADAGGSHDSGDKPYAKKKSYTAKPRGDQAGSPNMDSRASAVSRDSGYKPYAKKKPYSGKPRGEEAAGPNTDSRPSHGTGDKPYSKKKPYSAKPRDGRAQQGGKRHFDPRSDAPASDEKMPWEEEEKKPWVKKGKKSSKKSATKKSQKGKLGLKAPKMSAKARAAIQSGHAPMKRKKPKRDRV